MINLMLKERITFFIIYFSFYVLSSFVFGQSFLQKPTVGKIIDQVTNIPEGSFLVESHRIFSPHAKHYTYDQYIKGTRILHSGLKIHVRADESVSVTNYLVDDDSYLPTNFSDQAIFTDGHIVEVRPIQSYDGGYPIIRYYDSANQLIFEKDLIKYDKKDTSIYVKVFSVNPINSANVSYGGNFSDNNDLSNSSLENEMSWYKVPAKFYLDTFLLESEFLYFDDLSAPIDTFYYAINDSISDNRESGVFEYLNVYKHLNTIGEYVNYLGYDVITDTLVVDVHAFGGLDNSGYTPSEHSLQFGEGGIDDAEDGEVVVHEFVHSLSELASPNNTVGTERQAMEEGSCDYFSKAYSRTYNDNTPNKIFTWDGNQTWDGFPINSNRLYPIDLVNSKDGDRDIWSSALMCIHDKIGRLSTDSILLEHFFYQAPNTSMEQMARVILSIDSADFNMRYHSSIYDCFVDAGFVVKDTDTNQIDSLNFKVLNQQGFIHGEFPLEIMLPRGSTYIIFDMLGKQIADERKGSVLIQPSELNQGMYVIRISFNSELISIKILR
jgi:hypothetical protein